MKQFLRIKNRIIATRSIVQAFPPGGGGLGKLRLTNGDAVDLTQEEWANFEALVERECERFDRDLRKD